MKNLFRQGFHLRYKGRSPKWLRKLRRLALRLYWKIRPSKRPAVTFEDIQRLIKNEAEWWSRKRPLYYCAYDQFVKMNDDFAKAIKAQEKIYGVSPITPHPVIPCNEDLHLKTSTTGIDPEKLYGHVALKMIKER